MYDRLPPELKTEKAWVNVWDNSKVPMQSSIRKAASSVLPETWSDFDTAAAAVESGVYDGLGYVFHDTGLIGIDIDTGYVDESGCPQKLGKIAGKPCPNCGEQEAGLWGLLGRAKKFKDTPMCKWEE